MPKTDMALPKRLMLLIDKVEPKWRKSKTERDEPNLVIFRIEKAEPNLTQLLTERRAHLEEVHDREALADARLRPQRERRAEECAVKH